MLPELYSFGNTNLVSRPTRDQAELSKEEMEESTPILEAKIKKWRPEACCIVGKGIWESIFKYKMGRKLTKLEFEFGWQDMRLGVVEEGEVIDGVKQKAWEGARVFVAVSTSGLVAGYSWSYKVALLEELAKWVAERKKERGETSPRGLPDHVVKEAGEKRERVWQALREKDRIGGVKVEDELEAGEAAVKTEEEVENIIKTEEVDVKAEEEVNGQIEEKREGIKAEEEDI